MAGIWYNTVVGLRKRFMGIYCNIATYKQCELLDEYICLGFDTFGPFKLVGGLAKGHPTEEEIQGAVEFYQRL